MEGELVLDEEATVQAVEAMGIGSDTMKEKMKAWKKSSNLNIEREERDMKTQRTNFCN